MNYWEVLKSRGHVVEASSGSGQRSTHTGEKDDYDLARGPARNLTARSDKAMTTRDYRMPVDLTRSRRVGLRRTVCLMCNAVRDQGRTHHDASCRLPVGLSDYPRYYVEGTPPLSPTETAENYGWWARKLIR